MGYDVLHLAVLVCSGTVLMCIVTSSRLFKVVLLCLSSLSLCSDFSFPYIKHAFQARNFTRLVLCVVRLRSRWTVECNSWHLSDKMLIRFRSKKCCCDFYIRCQDFLCKSYRLTGPHPRFPTLGATSQLLTALCLVQSTSRRNAYPGTKHAQAKRPRRWRPSSTRMGTAGKKLGLCGNQLTLIVLQNTFHTLMTQARSLLAYLYLLPQWIGLQAGAPSLIVALSSLQVLRQSA